ncbi:MAG: threonine/serine dehydratase [Planctomycetales bacterium]|nr:threonine/serine dehydratase [Planctomycetales bacterium]
MSPATFMMVVGVIEIVAGLAILRILPRMEAQLVMDWLTLIALTVLAGGQYDIAVCDHGKVVGAYPHGQVATLHGDPWLGRLTMGRGSMSMIDLKENAAWPITYEQVLDAARRIQPFLPATALRNYPVLDRLLGCTVLVKHENHQPTGAFKVRNALAAMTQLDDAARSRGVVAASRGNHGLGLAYAGRLLNVPVTVCVPVDNSHTKNEAIEGCGAELVQVGKDYDEAIAFSQEFAARHQRTLIHSTNNSDVLAGAATLTLETLAQAAEQGQEIGAMYFAIGGGSQAVGALTVLRSRGLSIPVIGVQAASAPTLYDSFRAGHEVSSGLQPTIADGIATRSTYALTFQPLLHGLQDVLQVSETEIRESLRLLLTTTHNLVEGAAAVGLAGLRQSTKLKPHFAPGKAVVVVLSGANIDWNVLQSVVCQD